MACVAAVGCGNLRLPAIDPSGDRFFLPAPNYTTLDGFDSVAVNNSAGFLPQPAFTAPPTPPPCDSNQVGGAIGTGLEDRLRPARLGELKVVPTRVVAPVSSEVIVVGGICGSNGCFVPGKTLEWILAQESVGNFVQAGRGPFGSLYSVMNPSSGKRSANYIKTNANRNPMVIDRGTASPLDDVTVKAGQSWVTVTSPTEGTSYITVWSPDAEGWDQRRKTTTIHWIDACWKFPESKAVLAGTQHEMVVNVRRESNGEPVEGWLVEYEVLPDGTIAGFLPVPTADMATQGAPISLTSKATVRTDANGDARILLRQPTDQIGPGLTQVRVRLIRPENAIGTREKLTVAESVAAIQWSAPALTVRAEGPTVSPLRGEFVYSVLVSNPGDLPAENVTLVVDRPPNLEWIAGNPSPTQFGDQWMWNLGTLPAQSQPVRIELSARAIGQGKGRTCFRVASSNVARQAEACVETAVEVACIGFSFIDPPTEVRVGEAATFRLRLSNECLDPLTNVRVEAAFDEGLEFPGETSPVEIGPFNLAFGQVQELELPLQVVAPGRHCLRVAVTADGGHSAVAGTCVDASDVPRPSMDLVIEGPRMVRRGTETPYSIRVINTGNVAIPATQLFGRFSPELRPVRANVQSRMEQGVWVADLLPIEPRTATIVEVFLVGDVPTENAGFEMWAIGGEAGTETRAMPITIVPRPEDIIGVGPAGAAAPQPTPAVPQDPGVSLQGPGSNSPPAVAGDGRLELSLVELVDPVDLGQETALVVVVKNVSGNVDQDITAALSLPPGLTFVRSDAGPLTFAQDPARADRLVATRREMRAGDELTTRVFLRATAAGDQSVRAAVSSSQSTRPVEAATTIFVNP
ncbi:MAG: hypothetical protein R3B96_12565 [Pirellulaceae bacterium]